MTVQNSKTKLTCHQCVSTHWFLFLPLTILTAGLAILWNGTRGHDVVYESQATLVASTQHTFNLKGHNGVTGKKSKQSKQTKNTDASFNRGNISPNCMFPVQPDISIIRSHFSLSYSLRPKGITISADTHNRELKCSTFIVILMVVMSSPWC